MGRKFPITVQLDWDTVKGSVFFFLSFWQKYVILHIQILLKNIKLEKLHLIWSNWGLIWDDPSLFRCPYHANSGPKFKVCMTITGKPAGHAVTLPEELEEAFGLAICQCLPASVSTACLCCWQSVVVCFSPQRAVAWFTVWGQCNKFWVAIQYTQALHKPESLVWFAWHATGPSGPR